MNLERWRQIEALYHSVHERGRGVLVGADSELREEVERLLAQDSAGKVLDRPAADLPTDSTRTMLATGSQLGPYRIEALLGAGGMGEVFRATDTRLRRTVAIKVLRGDQRTDPDRTARFLQEARAASALNHPNIVTLYNIENDHGIEYLVMEYVPGKSLDKLIPHKGLPIAATIAYGDQIATALAAAHAAGIVHRDIKPSNVIVTPELQVKVLDFGLAKLEERGPRSGTSTVTISPALTEAGMVMGTRAYMSPEQARSEKVDARTDLFSLGAVLYEMATGTRAFVKALDWATPPTESLPPGLRRIVLKLLEPDRDQRYQTAADLAVDLKALQQAAAGESMSRRWRITGAGISAAILAVIATFVIAPRYRFEADRRVGTIRAEFSQVTSLPGIEWFPSLSPDGKWLVYASSGSGNRHIYLQSVGGQTPIDLTRDSTSDDDQPAFSFDGERIAFRSSREGGGIFVMGRTGEAVRRVTHMGFNPAWAPDGTQLAFTTDNTELYPQNTYGASELWTVAVSNGEARMLVEDARSPSWSPHNYRIAFTHRAGSPTQGNVWTVPIKGGTATPVTNASARDWDPTWSPDGKYLYFVSDRSGSMNLWRVLIDEASGKPLAEPEPITTPATYLAHPTLSADGKRIAYTSVLNTANIQQLALDPSGSVRGEPAWVTTGSRIWSSPDPSPDGEWVVFYSLAQPEGQLYISHPDGTALRQLNDGMAINRMPRWSPDGKWIVFSSNRSGHVAMWKIRPDGSEAQQVTEDYAAFPAWSWDGSRIATVLGYGEGPATAAVWIFDPNRPWKQQSPEPLARVGWSPLPFLAPSWSPDSEFIAGMLGNPGHGIAVYSMQSRKYERLTDFGEWPVWLPSGSRVLFVADGKAFFIVDTRSKQVTKVFSVTRDVIGPPRLTRDGKKMYFSRRITESDIWLLTLK